MKIYSLYLLLCNRIVPLGALLFKISLKGFFCLFCFCFFKSAGHLFYRARTDSFSVEERTVNILGLGAAWSLLELPSSAHQPEYLSQKVFRSLLSPFCALSKMSSVSVFVPSPSVPCPCFVAVIGT